MKTEPGEFVMLVPPSGQLVRMRTKSSVPSLMSSLLMSISLHTTEPSSPGSNVILKFSEQKSADTPVPVPAKVERTARVQCRSLNSLMQYSTENCTHKTTPTYHIHKIGLAIGGLILGTALQQQCQVTHKTDKVK